MEDIEGRKRDLTADEERWANLASLKVFNKSFDALMDDFDSTMGGIPADTLEGLIELGREIEEAEQVSTIGIGETTQDAVTATGEASAAAPADARPRQIPLAVYLFMTTLTVAAVIVAPGRPAVWTVVLIAWLALCVMHKRAGGER